MTSALNQDTSNNISTINTTMKLKRYLLIISLGLMVASLLASCNTRESNQVVVDNMFRFKLINAGLAIEQVLYDSTYHVINDSIATFKHDRTIILKKEMKEHNIVPRFYLVL